MFFGKLQDIIFSHKRFSAGQQIQVDAELFALRYDFIHIREGEIMLIAVGARPAAFAMHIARRGWIEQNQPRNIAVILLPVISDFLCTFHKSVIAEIQKRGLQNVRIRFVDRPIEHGRPAVIRYIQR